MYRPHLLAGYLKSNQLNVTKRNVNAILKGL